MLLTNILALIEIAIGKITSSIFLCNYEADHYLYYDFLRWMQTNGKFRLSLLDIRFFRFEGKWYFYRYSIWSKPNDDYYKRHLSIYTFGQSHASFKELIEEFSPGTRVFLSPTGMTVVRAPKRK